MKEQLRHLNSLIKEVNRRKLRNEIDPETWKMLLHDIWEEKRKLLEGHHESLRKQHEPFDDYERERDNR